MKRIFLLLLVALTFLNSVIAQWTFTVDYTNNCSGMWDELRADLEGTRIKSENNNQQYPDRNACEAARSSIHSPYNCLIIHCGPCTGHDVGGGSASADPNVSPNLLGPQQGSSFSPSNPANSVSTWMEDFMTKWNSYLNDFNDYLGSLEGNNGGGGSIDDYFNSVYEHISNYSSADRNILKKDNDSVSIYKPVYQNDNDLEKLISEIEGNESTTGQHINGIVEEKVPKKELKYDERGNLIYEGLKNENILPDLPDDFSEVKAEGIPQQEKIESRVYDLSMEPADESESVLGKIIEKVGGKLEEWGVDMEMVTLVTGDLGDLGYGFVGEAADDLGYGSVYKSVSTCLDLDDAVSGAANSIFDNALQMAKSNFTKADAERAWTNYKKTTVEFEIKIAKMILDISTPLGKAGASAYNKLKIIF